MGRIKWFSHGGGAFHKVSANMWRYTDEYNGPDCFATCNSSPGYWCKRDAKKVWFGGHNYNKFLKGRIKDLGIPDLIVGFSPFCAQTYRDLGHTAYDGFLGVDTDIYYPERMMRDSFKFLSTSWCDEYGLGALLGAWRMIYDSLPGAELLIKTHFLGGCLDHEILEAVENTPGAEFVKPLGWSYSENDLARLYSSADCLVYTAPSLGSSLTVLESMACGTPVIACQYSGFAPFINEDTGYPVRYKLEPVPNKPNLDEGAVWAVADQEHLAEQMVRAYKNEQELRQKSEASIRFVRDNYTWKRAADHFHKIVEENL